MAARKPTAVKQLAGTLQACRVNVLEPTPAKGWPPAPAYLSLREQAAWQETCQLLDAQGTLTLADAFAVEELAVLRAEVAELREDVRANGRYYTSNAGLEKLRPIVKLEAEKSRHLLALLSRFGLTPADRSRVNARAPDAGTNPFHDL